MACRALILSVLVALALSKAIVTNHCPHDVYIWSIPQIGSANTDNLPIKPGGRYEEPWRRGTASFPGIALKITPQANGIHEDKDEINFSYSVDSSDKSKVWVDLSAMRGKPFENNLAFHTCHGAYSTSDIATQPCSATDDVELVLCDTERTVPAQDSTPFDKIEACYDYHNVSHTTVHDSAKCTANCDRPSPYTSEEPSYPSPKPTTEVPPQSPYSSPAKPTSEQSYPPPEHTSEHHYPQKPTSNTPHHSPPQYTSEKQYSSPAQSSSEGYYTQKPTSNAPHHSQPQYTSEKQYSSPVQHSSGNYPQKPTSNTPHHSPPQYTSEKQYSSPVQHSSGNYPQKPTSNTPHHSPPQYTSEKQYSSPVQHSSGNYPQKPTSNTPHHSPPQYTSEKQYSSPVQHSSEGYYPQKPTSNTPHHSPPQYTSEKQYSSPPKPTSEQSYPSLEGTSEHHYPPKPTTNTPHGPPPQTTSEEQYPPPEQTSNSYFPPKPSSHSQGPPPKHTEGEQPPQHTSEHYPPPGSTSEEHHSPPMHTSDSHSPPSRPSSEKPYHSPPQYTSERPHHSPSQPTNVESHHSQYPQSTADQPQYPSPKPTSDEPHHPHSPPSSPPQKSTSEGSYSPPPQPTYLPRGIESKSTCETSQCKRQSDAAAPDYCMAKVVYPSRRAALLRDSNGQVKPRTTTPLGVVLQQEAAKPNGAQAVKKSSSSTPLCDVTAEYFPIALFFADHVCKEDAMKMFARETYGSLCAPSFQLYLLGMPCSEIQAKWKKAYPDVDKPLNTQAGPQTKNSTAKVVRNTTLGTGLQHASEPKMCLLHTCNQYNLTSKACDHLVGLFDQVFKDEGKTWEYTTAKEVCDQPLDLGNLSFPSDTLLVVEQALTFLETHEQEKVCSIKYCAFVTDEACDKAKAFLKQAAKDHGRKVEFTSDDDICGPPIEVRADNTTLSERAVSKACISWYCHPSVPGIQCYDARAMLKVLLRSRGLDIEDIMTDSGPEEAPCMSPPPVRHTGRPGVCIAPLCKKMQYGNHDCENLEDDMQAGAKAMLGAKIDYTTDDDVCG